MRIHLLLGEVMGHGGIQRYNRQLVRAAGDVATPRGAIRAPEGSAGMSAGCTEPNDARMDVAASAELKSGWLLGKVRSKALK